MATELTKRDWVIIRNTILSLQFDFLSDKGRTSETEGRIFTSLFLSTLRFNRFELVADKNTFLDGDIGADIFPIPVSTNWFYRCHASLLRKGLIERYSRGVKCAYRINVFGFLSSHAMLFTTWKKNEALLTTKEKNALKSVRRVLAKVEEIWEQYGWKKKQLTGVKQKMAKTEEMIAVGLEQSAKHKRKKREKVKKAEQMKAGWVKDLLSDYCEELGERFDNYWTVKEYSCAKSFIAECEQEKKDIKELLYDVCRSWGRIRSGLKMKNNEPLWLSPVVNFAELYKYRRKIIQWLTEHEREEGSSEKIIVMPARQL